MRQGIDETKIPRIEGAKIAILKSRWYSDVVESLADACRTALANAGCSSVFEHTLPGVFELPFAVHHLVRKVGQRFDAIICLGVILKGDTSHFEMITPEVFTGLARLSLEIDIPILVEILPCSSSVTLSSAQARTSSTRVLPRHRPPPRLSHGADRPGDLRRSGTHPLLPRGPVPTRRQTSRIEMLYGYYELV